MSKEQLTEQQPGQETGAPTSEAVDETYGLNPALVAQIKKMSPADDISLAEMLQAYPSLMGKILPVAAGHLGNAAVQRAMALVKQWKAQGRAGSMSHDEVRSTLSEPSDSLPVKSNEMASILEDASDPQAPAEVSTEKPKQAAVADPPWVVEARRYNKVIGAYNVEVFNELTDNFLTEEGSEEVDPRAVASWQRAHGLDPDGKVGPRTVAAARAAKAKNTNVAQTEAPDARIPV